ncbi:MAG: anaerobic ribonucleoside-triphosphate reductase activating protein [Pirellulaceae bacterium]|jgi:anaerobic ribonucleoside-triphosphate reductase activating protein
MKTSTDATLQIAQTVSTTEAEGPGRRFAIWFQGCPLRCAGCCNPEMLPFTGGNETTPNDLIAEILEAKERHGIEGITMMGGEPFSHAAGAAIVAEMVRQNDLSVMIFSGFILEDLRLMPEPEIKKLLTHTDILVDGPYERDQPEFGRRWIGSANQRIHFLTERYSKNDARWDEPNTLEIRVQDGEISVNGFPASSAVGLWKRPRKNR